MVHAQPDADAEAFVSADAEALQTLQQLRRALRGGRMSIWRVKNGVLAHNVELNRLLGYPDEASPTLEQVCNGCLPDDRERIQAIVEGKLQGDERFFEAEAQYRRPDGGLRWLLLRAELILHDGPEPPEIIGVLLDVTKRKTAEERLKLLAREVDHRANNLLTVVQAAVALAKASDPEELRKIILCRLQALAGAHRLLSFGGWQGAELRQMMEEELSAYGVEERIHIRGEPLNLQPELAQGLTLAVHELATNALKYGALSRPEGRVELQWRVEDGWLDLEWRETGGPAVTPPSRKGFGATLLDHALTGPIGGSCRLDMRAEGVVCHMRAPVDAARKTSH